MCVAFVCTKSSIYIVLSCCSKAYVRDGSDNGVQCARSVEGRYPRSSHSQLNSRMHHHCSMQTVMHACISIMGDGDCGGPALRMPKNSTWVRVVDCIPIVK